MNTPLKNDQRQKTKPNPWAELQSQLTDDDRLEMDAQMLMFRFLSEVEKEQELQGVSRKELAQRIQTSPSYLTQLWRGDKPLNFRTLAKMQQALGMSFQISSTQREGKDTKSKTQSATTKHTAGKAVGIGRAA